MRISIFRSILIGVLVGALIVVATKVILVLLIVGAIFKLSGVGRWKKKQWKEQRLAFVENIRGMSDEEFNHFKENFGKNRKCYSH